MDARTEARQRYCVFDTPIGACGIAWNEHGITRFRLPEATRATTEQRMARGAQADEPPWSVAAVIAEVLRYFAGTKVDFASVALDLPDIVPFHRRVYDAARA